MFTIIEITITDFKSLNYKMIFDLAKPQTVFRQIIEIYES